LDMSCFAGSCPHVVGAVNLRLLINSFSFDDFKVNVMLFSFVSVTLCNLFSSNGGIENNVEFALSYSVMFVIRTCLVLLYVQKFVWLIALLSVLLDVCLVFGRHARV
jgi:hypothetical protein